MICKIPDSSSTYVLSNSLLLAVNDSRKNTSSFYQLTPRPTKNDEKSPIGLQMKGFVCLSHKSQRNVTSLFVSSCIVKKLGKRRESKNSVTGIYIHNGYRVRLCVVVYFANAVVCFLPDTFLRIENQYSIHLKGNHNIEFTNRSHP